jgi:hypothetical protein
MESLLRRHGYWWTRGKWIATDFISYRWPTDLMDTQALGKMRATCEVLRLADATCIINPGEHAFISRKSYVYYAFATLYSAETLAARCAEGTCQRQDPVSPELLVRVLKGSLNSLHTKQRIRGLCKIAYKDIDDDDLPF